MPAYPVGLAERAVVRQRISGFIQQEVSRVRRTGGGTAWVAHSHVAIAGGYAIGTTGAGIVYNAEIVYVQPSPG